MFGDAEPVTTKQWLNAVGCELDVEFLNTWKNKQQQLFKKYKDLFNWDRVIESQIKNLATMDKYH